MEENERGWIRERRSGDHVNTIFVYEILKKKI